MPATEQRVELPPIERATLMYAAEELLFRLSDHPAFADKKEAINQLQFAIVEGYQDVAEANGLSVDGPEGFGLRGEEWIREQGLDDIGGRGIGEATAMLIRQVDYLASSVYGEDVRWDQDRGWVDV